ncbi:MAG: hypothetical protein JW902_15445, partial [Syntrophaceae bacterium]|nr:hypothetical protein [Syntrophaceae bacterium]
VAGDPGQGQGRRRLSVRGEEGQGCCQLTVGCCLLTDNRKPVTDNRLTGARSSTARRRRAQTPTAFIFH